MGDLTSDTKETGGGDSNQGSSSSEASKSTPLVKLDSTELFKLPGDEDQDEIELAREKGKSDSEIFKDLKAQLK